MINTEDQEALFTLISTYLKKNVTCYAIGGTAMMFYGYKTTTKDIDLVFHNNHERETFIHAITELGYKEKGLQGVYDDKRREHKGKPLLYTRGDERFDLFVHNVFGFELPPELPITQRHDYPERLTILILSKEHLVLLKAITDRETDYTDIVTMVRVEKTMNWDRIIDEAIHQHNNNEWILIDLEKTLTKLKEITFIPTKHFKKIYSAQEKK